MSDSDSQAPVKRGPGRPRKHPAVVPAAKPAAKDKPAPVLPAKLASAVVAKALDKAGLHEAATVVGAAIADEDQSFRDDVRGLCGGGMPVTFKLNSQDEASHCEQVVLDMEGPPGMRYVPKRSDSWLQVSLRSR